MFNLYICDFIRSVMKIYADRYHNNYSLVSVIVECWWRLIIVSNKRVCFCRHHKQLCLLRHCSTCRYGTSLCGGTAAVCTALDFLKYSCTMVFSVLNLPPCNMPLTCLRSPESGWGTTFCIWNWNCYVRY